MKLLILEVDLRKAVSVCFDAPHRAYTDFHTSDQGQSMNTSQLVNLTIAIACEHGWRIETNRGGLTQIDFKNKKLHSKHLEAMFPEILADGASVSEIIERISGNMALRCFE